MTSLAISHIYFLFPLEPFFSNVYLNRYTFTPPSTNKPSKRPIPNSLSTCPTVTFLYENRNTFLFAFPFQWTIMSTNVHLKFLFLLFFSSSLWDSHAQHVPGVAAPNSIKPGDTLNSSSSLNSPNGRFMLRFYLWPAAFGTTNYTYLTMFRTSDWRLVWYTRQGIPITNDFDLLTLENNAGSLKIRRHGDNPIELSSSPQPTNNTVASLLDSGNFVFNEVYSNGSKKRLLWKSFDYPGKVLLPGMKLGVNHKTGQNWSLIAWLTDDYPVPGAFTLEYSGHQLIIRRRNVVYWKSGVLRGNEFENISPKVTSMYHFSVVSNENEESFSFMSKNGSQESRWLFTSTGQLLGDDPQPIAQADKCDGYNIDGGCQRWNQPLCRHHHQHGYTVELNRGYFVSEDDSSYNISDTNLGISDCKVSCWGNCNCVAYTSLFANRTGCKFWTNISNFVPNDLTYLDLVYILSPKLSHSGKFPRSVSINNRQDSNFNNISWALS